MINLLRNKWLQTIVMILSILFLLGWSNSSIPKPTEGTISLEEWDFDKNGVIQLDGEWNFYWNTLDPSEIQTSERTMMSVPSVWDKNNAFPSLGYGIYHLRVTHLQEGKDYGLKIPTLSTAYRLFIDHKILTNSGHPGKTKKESIPHSKPKEVYFTAASDTIDIYIAISNFHYRSGGMWSSIELGTSEQIANVTKKNVAIDALLIGSLILAGLYHLVLFYYRKKEKKLLLFGLICFTISARTFVIGEQIINQFSPWFPWAFIIKVEYLTFFSVLPLFSWFMHYLYTKEISIQFSKMLTLISIIFSLFVIVTPPIVFTKIIYFYQGITILAILYFVYALFLALKREREGTIVIFLFGAFYGISVINDILYVNRVIQSVNLSSFGLFVFIFSQSYLLAKGLSRAFIKEEEHSIALAEINHTLEDKIKQRTESLEKSKQKLQHINEYLTKLSYYDQLTEIPNRRSFDDIYETKWLEAMEQKTILSILYFDIDHFKTYNDTYGHQAGDVTLKKVATHLKGIIEKHNGTVARMGGEEFIALVPNTAKKNAKEIAEQCRKQIMELNIQHESSPTSPFVTISIGVATAQPNEQKNKRELIKAADDALYFAKENERNRVYVNENNM